MQPFSISGLIRAASDWGHALPPPSCSCSPTSQSQRPHVAPPGGRFGNSRRRIPHKLRCDVPLRRHDQAAHRGWRWCRSHGRGPEHPYVIIALKKSSLLAANNVIKGSNKSIALVINKFQRSTTNKCWNHAFWLVKTSHMTCNIQSYLYSRAVSDKVETKFDGNLNQMPITVGKIKIFLAAIKSGKVPWLAFSCFSSSRNRRLSRLRLELHDASLHHQPIGEILAKVVYEI